MLDIAKTPRTDPTVDDFLPHFEEVGASDWLGRAEYCRSARGIYEYPMVDHDRFSTDAGPSTR